MLNKRTNQPAIEKVSTILFYSGSRNKHVCNFNNFYAERGAETTVRCGTTRRRHKVRWKMMIISIKCNGTTTVTTMSVLS